MMQVRRPKGVSGKREAFVSRAAHPSAQRLVITKLQLLLSVCLSVCLSVARERSLGCKFELP